MRQLLIALATLTSFTGALPVRAQDIPQPSLQGEGESSQELGLIKNTISVAVDAGGAFNTKSGEAGGSVGVGGHSVGLGSATPSATVPPSESAGPLPRSQAPDSTSVPGIEVDAGVAGSVAATQAPFDGDAAVCVAGVPASATEIAAMGPGTQVLMQPSCGAAPMGIHERQALEANSVLVAYLAARDIAPSDVVSVTMLREMVVIDRTVSSQIIGSKQ